MISINSRFLWNSECTHLVHSSFSRRLSDLQCIHNRLLVLEVSLLGRCFFKTNATCRDTRDSLTASCRLLAFHHSSRETSISEVVVEWRHDPGDLRGMGPASRPEAPVPGAPPASSSLGGYGVAREVGRKGVPASGRASLAPLSVTPFLNGSGVSKEGDGPPCTQRPPWTAALSRSAPRHMPAFPEEPPGPPRTQSPCQTSTQWKACFIS